jgi:hypothetical protein
MRGRTTQDLHELRHEDINGTAWAVYRRLERRFGTASVFFDNGKLQPGEQWLDEITAYMAEADVLLVLIGPAWVGTRSERLRHPTRPERVLRRRVGVASAW